MAKKPTKQACPKPGKKVVAKQVALASKGPAMSISRPKMMKM